MNKASSVLVDYQKRRGEGRGGEESWGCVFATKKLQKVACCCLWNFDVGLVRKSDQIRPKSRDQEVYGYNALVGF